MDAKTQENLRKHGGFAFDFNEIIVERLRFTD